MENVITNEKEIKIDYYKRYLNYKLELGTLEREIALLKSRYDRAIYSGCHDVAAVDYSKTPTMSQNEDINKLYNNIVLLGKEIREKELQADEIKNLLSNLEKQFHDYSANNFNDIEMRVFMEVYVQGKKINQVLISKNGQEFYSERQIKRYHKAIKKKIE